MFKWINKKLNNLDYKDCYKVQIELGLAEKGKLCLGNKSEKKNKAIKKAIKENNMFSFLEHLRYHHLNCENCKYFRKEVKEMYEAPFPNYRIQTPPPTIYNCPPPSYWDVKIKMLNFLLKNGLTDMKFNNDATFDDLIQEVVNGLFDITKTVNKMETDNE